MNDINKTYTFWLSRCNEELFAHRIITLYIRGFALIKITASYAFQLKSSTTQQASGIQ